jgi:hypothetical protein
MNEAFAHVTCVPGYETTDFRIDGGDGDQRLFGTPLNLQRVKAHWFTGQLGQLFGEAWLVRVSDGPKGGAASWANAANVG